MKKEFWQKMWAKWESGLTAVQLKWDPPVVCSTMFTFHECVGLERTDKDKKEKFIQVGPT